MRNTTNLQPRLDREIAKAIRESARRNFQSVAAEVNRRLRESLGSIAVVLKPDELRAAKAIAEKNGFRSAQQWAEATIVKALILK